LNKNKRIGIDYLCDKRNCELLWVQSENAAVIAKRRQVGVGLNNHLEIEKIKASNKL
jgi:hypothetical protein